MCFRLKHEKFRGVLYAFWELPLHALDGLLEKVPLLWRVVPPYKKGHVYAFRRLGRTGASTICSWAVAATEQDCASDWHSSTLPDPAPVDRCAFGVPPKEATPDDIYDYVTGPGKARYRLVYSNREGRRKQ